MNNECLLDGRMAERKRKEEKLEKEFTGGKVWFLIGSENVRGAAFILGSPECSL
jgi:hypothetical protein